MNDIHLQRTGKVLLLVHAITTVFTIIGMVAQLTSAGLAPFRSLIPLFLAVVGILLLIGFAQNTDYIAMLVAGLIIILYMPVTLYTRAKKQMLLNPAFKNSIHYKMNDEGVTVSNGDEEALLEWDSMYKAYSTNQSIILATSKVNAWIFPKKDLGEDKFKLIEMISTHMPPDKIRIKQ